MIVLWQVFSRLRAWRLRNEVCVSCCEYVYIGMLKRDESNYIYHYGASEYLCVNRLLE